jgi:hypothetical protein
VAYGSGSWMQSADRVCATLARGADDTSSGPRIKGAVGDALIPSSPGRRLDSLQPELTGTASTVARRFTVFDATKRRVMIIAGACAAVGISLIVATVVYRGRQPAEAEALPLAASPLPGTPPPAESALLPGPVTGVITAPVHTAGPENEITEPAPGTVIGASPTPSPSAVASALKATAATATPPPPAVTAKVAPQPTPVRRYTPPTSTAKLPNGLPRTRD